MCTLTPNWPPVEPRLRLQRFRYNSIGVFRQRTFGRGTLERHLDVLLLQHRRKTAHRDTSCLRRRGGARWWWFGVKWRTTCMTRRRAPMRAAVSCFGRCCRLAESDGHSVGHCPAVAVRNYRSICPVVACSLKALIYTLKVLSSGADLSRSGSPELHMCRVATTRTA